jgi:hypothetical protein
MKFKFFCFLLIIVFPVSGIFPQGANATRPLELSLHAGISQPVLEMNLKHENMIGAAFLGYAMILEGKKSFDEHFSSVSSINISINACKGKKDGDLKAGNYVSSWLSTGIGAQTDISSTGKLFASAQIGILFLHTPDRVYTGGNYPYYYTLFYCHNDLTWATGYNVNVGVTLSRTKIMLRYYYARPEFPYTDDTDRTIQFKSPRYSLGLVQLTFGIVL